MLMSSSLTPLCSLPMMMAVGRVKSQVRSGLAAGVKVVARICMFRARRLVSSSWRSRWRTLSTHLRAEAEVLRPSTGKGVSV